MIRPLLPGDAEDVALLIRSAFAAIPVPLDPAPSALRVSGADVLEQMASGGGFVWDEGGLRGCVLWRPQDDALYLGRLAVASGWQGRGIARALVDAVETQARQAGLVRLTLEVRLPLAGNRRLFATCGFRETVQRAHPGYSSPTSVMAEKRLD